MCMAYLILGSAEPTWIRSLQQDAALSLVHAAALWRAVLPSSSQAFAEAPALSKKYTHSSDPEAAALCNGVSPFFVFWWTLA